MGACVGLLIKRNVDVSGIVVGRCVGMAVGAERATPTVGKVDGAPEVTTSAEPKVGSAVPGGIRVGNMTTGVEFVSVLHPAIARLTMSAVRMFNGAVMSLYSMFSLSILS